MVRWEFDWLLQGHKDDVKTLIIFYAWFIFNFLIDLAFEHRNCWGKIAWNSRPKTLLHYYFWLFCVYYSLVICNVFTLLTQIFLYIRLIYLFFFPSTYSTPIHFFVLYPIYMWSNFLIKDSLFYSNILWTHQLFSDLRKFN